MFDRLLSSTDTALWDNTMARHLGFRPKENAERFREHLESTTEVPERDDLFVAVHGGAYARAGHFED